MCDRTCLAKAWRPSGARLAGQAVISDSKRSTMLDPDGVHVAFAVWGDTVGIEYSIIVVLWTDGSTLMAAEVEANLSLPFKLISMCATTLSGQIYNMSFCPSFESWSVRGLHGLFFKPCTELMSSQCQPVSTCLLYFFVVLSFIKIHFNTESLCWGWWSRFQCAFPLWSP